MSKILETQNQMIIRFPEQVAAQINAYFDGEGQPPSLEVQMNRQHAKHIDFKIGLKVNVNGQNYKATIMELPTTSSTFKTLDGVNFFKSNDISEMILVHGIGQDDQSIREDEAEPIKDASGKIVKYKCESGLTDYAKYIRQKNFKLKSAIPKDQVNNVVIQLEKIQAQIRNRGEGSSAAGTRN